MTDVSFGGSAARNGFTQSYVHSMTNVHINAGRNAFNGATPMVITALYGYLAGNGATRSVRMALGSASVTLSVASDSSANDTGWKTCSFWYTNGGSAQYGYYDMSGSCYFARSSTSGATDTQGAFGTFTGTLGGSYRYIESPNSPTLNSLSLTGTSGQISVDFTAPTDNGGSAITTYDIHYSTSATFVTYTKVTGVTSSPAVITVPPGNTYYIRVVAHNYVTDVAGTTSVASSTMSLFVPSGGKVWSTTSSAWVPGITKVWSTTSSAWVNGNVKVWSTTSSAWVPAN